MVTAQFGPMSFSGQPEDVGQWGVREIGQLLLRASIEFDRLIARGLSREAAADNLRVSKLGFPAAIIKALTSLSITSQQRTVRPIRVKDLSPGMILDEDLVSPKGIRLVPSGQEVTRTLIVRLTSIAAGVGVVEPFRVQISI